MTKEQLIFSVMNVVRGQAPTQDSGKFVHPQDIELEIEKAYETIVSNYMNDDNLAAKLELEYFSKSYDLTIKNNNGQPYVDLPATPLPIPGGGGFHLVTPKNSHVFVSIISKEEFTSFRNLEAFCCSPRPFAYPEISEKKLLLQGNRPEYDMLDEITVAMVSKFSDYEDSDEINVPGGSFPLTQMILQQMGLRPTDNTNDDGR